MALAPCLQTFAIGAFASFAAATANHTWASGQRRHASKFTHPLGLKLAGLVVFKHTIQALVVVKSADTIAHGAISIQKQY